MNYKCNAVLYEFMMPLDGGTKKKTGNAALHTAVKGKGKAIPL
jgi:hypothetical protein